MNPSHHEPSSDPINDSDDELFGRPSRNHETVATVPLPPAADSNEASENSEDEHETIATMPLPRDSVFANGRITQPTQILPRSPAYNNHNHNSSSPSLVSTHVQVLASSPTAVATPGVPRYNPGQANGYRRNMMAPAGTSFRQPVYPAPSRVQKPIRISDDDVPTYQADSSDDEDEKGGKGATVKTTNFQRTAVVPDTPPRDSFSALLQQFNHNTTAAKRPGDDLSYAYGNVSKKSRQTGPSRARPVRPQQQQREPTPPFELDDIENLQDRVKVRKMTTFLTGVSVRTCHNALKRKNGHYDDAISYVLETQERTNDQGKTLIDLVSDDELTTTPATQKNKPIIKTKQQAREPAQTITERYGTVHEKPTRDTKQLGSFSPPKARRRLVQGRKDRSSLDLPDIDEDRPRSKLANTIVLDDSDDDAEVKQTDDNVAANLPFNARVLQFFNTCTAADLTDTASIDAALAQHFVSLQPFASLSKVSLVKDPLKTSSKTKPVGEKVLDKVEEMLSAYEAVDFLVQKCDKIAAPLKKAIAGWGADSTNAGEVEITSMEHSPGHDSGIGTPEEGKSRSQSRSKDYINQPAIMNSKYQLNEYQVVGMNWLNLLYRRNLSCILADDMGLGKTYQVIAFLTHLFETGNKGPHLVVVPSATLENWLMEFKKFSPKLKVEPYYATAPGARAELRLHLDDTRDDVNVVVTTYHIAKAKEDTPWLREYDFDCTIFDEGHYLKNAESLVTKRMNRIGGNFRVLLTGTPLQNNLKELISLLAFLMPELFQEKMEELQAIFEHTVKTMDENHEALLSAERISRARSMLTPFILRRKKNQVLKELPVKVSRVEFCELTPEQHEIYDMWKNKATDIATRRERGENIGQETTHILMKLRQASIHPWLFRRLYKEKALPKIAKQCLKAEQWAASSPELIVKELNAYSDMEIHTLCAKNAVLNSYALQKEEWLASGKIVKMLELLRSFIAEGSRTLIFSQFTMMLDILEVVLDHEEINYFRLDGGTRVDQRQGLIDTFSEAGNNTPVFMLSTRAGGAGINLASANKVIIFDSGFNPQDDIQAENRAHRIGQTKPVEVVRLVTKNTVEEAIYKMGLAKVELDQRVAGTVSSGVSTPAGEVQETATGQEDKMTQQEAQGMKMVADMFFGDLKSGKGSSKEDLVQEIQETSRDNKETGKPVPTTDLAETATIKSDPIKAGIIKVEETDGKEIKLAGRARKPTSGVKASSSSTSQGSARSSGRSSRNSSRK